MFLPIYVEENQGSSSKDDELLCQEQTEVADESQTQGAEKDEPMTVHFAFNCFNILQVITSTVKTRIQEHPFSGFRLIGFLYIGYFS